MTDTIHVQISDALHLRLEKISKSLNCSKADVFRRGIALVEVMEQATKEDRKLAVIDSDGNVISHVVAT